MPPNGSTYTPIGIWRANRSRWRFSHGDSIPPWRDFHPGFLVRQSSNQKSVARIRFNRNLLASDVRLEVDPAYDEPIGGRSVFKPAHARGLGMRKVPLDRLLRACSITNTTSADSRISSQPIDINGEKWCRRRDSNPRPSHYECDALPSELLRRRGEILGMSKVFDPPAQARNHELSSDGSGDRVHDSSGPSRLRFASVAVPSYNRVIEH